MGRKSVRRKFDTAINWTVLRWLFFRYRHFFDHGFLIGKELRHIVHNYAVSGSFPKARSKCEQSFIEAFSECEDNSGLERLKQDHPMLAGALVTRPGSGCSLISHRAFHRLQRHKKDLYLLGLKCTRDVMVVWRLPGFRPLRAVAIWLFPLWDHVVRTQLHDIGFRGVSARGLYRNGKIRKGDEEIRTEHSKERWTIYRHVSTRPRRPSSKACVAVLYLAEKSPPLL